jgi:Mannose-6-phosphate isomerase
MHALPQSFVNPPHVYYFWNAWPPVSPFSYYPHPYNATGSRAAYPSHGANLAHMRFDPWSDLEIKDYGRKPLVINIERAAKQNDTFRTALWTGEHFQVTLMSIPVGGDIGLEVHPDTDQFIRVEEGQGLVEMGDARDKLDFRANAGEDFAIMIPAGKWHNLTNTGNIPLKLYVIYAPPEHPFGTVHRTKADAAASEKASQSVK